MGLGTLVVVLAIPGGLDTGTASHVSPTLPTSASSDPTTSTTKSTERAPFTAIGTYDVGTTSVDISEPTGNSSRALPTAVWYPAKGSGAGSAPATAQGPYPLLVFSQGYDLSVSAYAGLLEAWASAGFVVAAPTYPHTDPSDPAGLDDSDIVNHPADLRLVIETVLATARASGSVLSGLINSNEVGLVGHSDGGDVSLAVADNSCCQAPMVKAVVSLSGAELTSFGGHYFGDGSVPLLVVQGSADIINVPACSVQIYDAAPSPKYYLDLLGAPHESPYVESGTVVEEVVATVTTEFFDAELAGQTKAIGAMVAGGNMTGVTTMTVGGSAPPAAGSCPGAPG